MLIDEQEAHSEVESPFDIMLGDEMAGATIHRLESCQGVWMFDTGRERFCRVPRGGQIPPAIEWSRYYEFEVDLSRGCFSVRLSADGTSILRSWFHVDPCRFCCSGRGRHTENRTAAIGDGR